MTIRYEYLNQQGLPRSTNCTSLNMALRLASRDHESQVKRPIGIVMTDGRSITRYSYQQILVKCKALGLLK